MNLLLVSIFILISGCSKLNPELLGGFFEAPSVGKPFNGSTDQSINIGGVAAITSAGYKVNAKAVANASSRGTTTSGYRSEPSMYWSAH